MPANVRISILISLLSLVVLSFVVRNREFFLLRETRSFLDGRRQFSAGPALRADEIPSVHHPPIVFVSRSQLSLKNAVPGMGPLHRTAKVGGSLIIRESDGRLRTLVDSTKSFDGTALFDVSDPKVSWDASRIVFAGVEHRDSSWRIYEIRADGSGFRKITQTDRAIELSQFGAAAKRFMRYDDIDPCYLPDGRIVFASTRFPAVTEYGDVLATNLFVVNQDGTHLHRITTERNGAEQPTIDPSTGRIVYARWWLNIDRPSSKTRDGITRRVDEMVVDDQANLWHAITITPDGDDITLYAADPRTRVSSQSYRPVVLPDGKLVSVFSPNTSLVPSPEGFGIRWFTRGADTSHHIIGTQQISSSRNEPPSSVCAPPFATDPVMLPDGNILVSYSADGRDYGLYRCRFDGSGLTRLVDMPHTVELNGDVVFPKPVPPILQTKFGPPKSDLPPTEDPATFYRNDSFRFDCLNIFTNAAVDIPIGNALPITRNASIKFFLNFQRQNARGMDPSILIRTAPVHANGSVHEHDLPADVPMFEQVVDSSGNVLVSRDNSAAHVTGLNFNRAGTGTACVGCHAGHTMIPVPKNYSDAEWFNASTSAHVSASSTLTLHDTIRFLPEYTIDRKVHLSTPYEHWIADGSQNPYIELTWETEIEVRSFVLYKIPFSSIQGTPIRIQDYEIMLFRGKEKVFPIERRAAKNRLQIDIIPPHTIDRVRILIKQFSGASRDRHLAGLAEVETIARIVP